MKVSVNGREVVNPVWRTLLILLAVLLIVVLLLMALGLAAGLLSAILIVVGGVLLLNFPVHFALRAFGRHGFVYREPNGVLTFRVDRQGFKKR